MSNVKFLTVYDDEQEIILNGKHMYGYKLAYLPTFYKYKNKSFMDGINAHSSDFEKHKSEITEFGISSNVFQYVYELVSKRGYKTLCVICPHGKVLPYYRAAATAEKRYMRNSANRTETDAMPVYIFDSKAFGIAPILMADKLAEMYSYSAMPTELLIAYAKRFAASSVTYLLTADKNIYNDCFEMRAYRITSSRVFLLDLKSDNEKLKTQHYLQLVKKAIKKRNGKFAVSYGASCSFADSILTQLKFEYAYEPIVEAQYSIPSTKILGFNSMCIHLGDYF